MSVHEVEVEEIIEIARGAGEVVMRFYDEKYNTDIKTDHSPVTDADLAVHNYLIEKLSVYNFPILSEEGVSGFKDDREYSYMWVVDPLDGTKDFIQKTGDFAIMIGLVDGTGSSVLGVVYAPAIDEMYYAQNGEGAFLVHEKVAQKLSVSAHGLEQGKIFVSRNHLGEWEQSVAEKYNMEQITMGSAGLKICKIAEGEAELYINSSDKCGIWDTCAADIILQESGGIILTMKGEKVLYDYLYQSLIDGFVVSSKKESSRLHEESLNKE